MFSKRFSEADLCFSQMTDPHRTRCESPETPPHLQRDYKVTSESWGDTTAPGAEEDDWRGNRTKSGNDCVKLRSVTRGTTNKEKRLECKTWSQKKLLFGPLNGTGGITLDYFNADDSQSSFNIFGLIFSTCVALCHHIDVH